MYTASYYGDSLAAVYDQLYPGTPDADQAAQFISENAPGGSVLELGVGTGRIALPMVSQGLDVHGVDVSSEMLSKLKERDSEGTVTTTQVDFTTDLPEGRFDVTLVALNTLFMVTEPQKQIDTLRLMRSRTTTGGIVVVETYNPLQYHGLTAPRVDAHHLQDGQVVLSTSYVDRTIQTVLIAHTILGDDAPQRVMEVSRYAWPSELDLMARLAGLRLRDRYADWNGGAVTQDCHRYISVYEVADNDD